MQDKDEGTEAMLVHAIYQGQRLCDVPFPDDPNNVVYSLLAYITCPTCKAEAVKLIGGGIS